jgi:hypothetical protein
LEETTKKLFLQWEIVNSAKPLAGKLKDLLPSDGKEDKIHLFFTDQTAFLEEMIKRMHLKGKIKTLEVKTKVGII